MPRLCWSGYTKSVSYTHLYAFDFDNPEDPDAQEILAFVQEQGIAQAVKRYCQLDLQVPLEQKLYELILAQYYADRTLDGKNPEQLVY